jgi:hypothetical protein
VVAWARCSDCGWRISYDDWMAVDRMAIAHALKYDHVVTCGVSRAAGSRAALVITPMERAESVRACDTVLRD